MYTAALEMHIEVQQGLQKVSAYTEDMFGPEEIDLHLTKQQNRLVEEIVNRKFEDIQTGLDYIKPLIVKNNRLQAYIPQTSDSFYETKMVYGVLPSNYLHLVNDRSGVVTSNNYPLCNDISSYKTNTAFQSDRAEYVAAIPMVVSTAVQAPYFYNFTVALTVGGTLTPVLTTPAGLWNIRSRNSGFYVSNYIMEMFNYPGVKVYWETYRGMYYPGCFVFVTNSPSITKVDMYCTRSSADTQSGGTSTANFALTSTYKIPNYAAIPGYNLNYNPNTLTEADDFYTQNTNVFYQSKKQAPKSVLSDQYLMAYESISFLISELTIDYVRIPKQISLSLNQISELGGNGPSVVVDRTVEYLKLAIENPSYSGVVSDNKTRNQI